METFIMGFLRKLFGKLNRTEDKYYEIATDECQKTEVSQKSESPMVRKHAKPEISRFFDDTTDFLFIVFDVETNGLEKEYSVLSCSAIKYHIDLETYETSAIDRFDRFYFPVEEFNYSAIYINGLTRDVITQRREEGKYPEHFRTDSDFETFCSDTKRFVAHNISFDMQFIPFMEGKKKFCTMMTNMDIVCAYFLEWKNQWKWPKLSETAIHYGIQFSEKELHSSMADAELTAKIFMKMLKAAKTNGNGVTVQIDDSRQNLDPFHDFTWQLKIVNVNMVSQCKVGDVLNLTRERKNDAVNYLGVATKSGEHLGDIDSSDVKYYGLIHDIDHGAKTSVKIKQIFTTNGNFASINVKVFIGNADWKNKKELDDIDRETKRIITIAKTLEKTNPEASVSLYRKAIEMLKGIDLQCEKHFSTWRKQKFPINRLSLVLERQKKYQECLGEIEAYEKVIDKAGLYAGEKEIIGKRKERMLKAIKKRGYKNNLGEVDTKIGYTEDQIKLLIKNHDYKKKDHQAQFKSTIAANRGNAYMSAKLVKRNFVIDKDVIKFQIDKYECRIVYGNKKDYGESSEEPIRISVLIEMLNGEGMLDNRDKPFETFLYKNNLYKVDTKHVYTEDQMKLLVKHHYCKENEKFKKIQKEIELFESVDKKRTDNDG